MQITVNRVAFLKALYFAQSIADRKSTTPAISNVLLRTQGKDSVLCAATDLRTSLIAEIRADAKIEGGLSVGAKHLYEIIRNITDTEITLKGTENNWIQIHVGKARYKLVGLAEREFPQLPDHNDVPFHEVSAAALAELLSKTIFSASSDDTRQHLAGVYLEWQDEIARAVSTDGHRLTKVERSLGKGPSIEDGVIIPRKGVLEIRKLLESKEGSCDIGVAAGRVFVKAADIVLCVALIDAQFPPYQQVIPQDNDKCLRLDRMLFLEALKRASIMSSERSCGIRVDLSSGRLRISSDNPDLGEAEEDLEVEYDGPDLVIGFNARYFIDVLAEMNDAQVCLELSGELDPGLVRPSDSRDYLGVVMPMRI